MPSDPRDRIDDASQKFDGLIKRLKIITGQTDAFSRVNENLAERYRRLVDETGRFGTVLSKLGLERQLTNLSRYSLKSVTDLSLLITNLGAKGEASLERQRQLADQLAQATAAANSNNLNQLTKELSYHTKLMHAAQASGDIGKASDERGKVQVAKDRFEQVIAAQEAVHRLSDQLALARQETAGLEGELSGLLPIANRLPSLLSSLERVALIKRDAGKFLAGTALEVNFLGGLKQTLDLSSQYGKSLIKADASLLERNRLLKDGLAVQYQTAATVDEVASVQRALVDEGFDLRSGYRDTLKIATELTVGLGLSAGQAVRLKVTADQTHQSYLALADSVATLVDKTGLAADEATRYYESLSKAAVVAAAPGLNRQVNLGGIETAATVEGHLKGTFATQGGIADLVKSFTTYSRNGGMGAAFGTGGINFLTRPDATERTMKALKGVISYIGDSSGPVLEAFAEQLGTDVNTLDALRQAYKDQGDALFKLTQAETDRSKIESRYQKQVADQGEAFGRLGNALKSLMAYALAPLVPVVRGVSYALEKLLAHLPDLGIVGMIPVGIAAVTLTRSLIMMTAAMARASLAASGLGTSSIVGGIEKAAGGGLISKVFGGLFKKAVVTEGAQVAETGIVSVIKGAIGRGLGLLFSRVGLMTILRPILAGGAELLGGIFTGGLSIIATIAIGALIQFWPQIWRWLSGKTSAAKAAENADLRKNQSDTLGRILLNKVEESNSGTRSQRQLLDSVRQYYQLASQSHTDPQVVALWTKQAVEAARQKVVQFSQMAQLRQDVDPYQTNVDRENTKLMLVQLEELNSTVKILNSNYEKSADRLTSLEQTHKEEEDKRRLQLKEIGIPVRRSFSDVMPGM